MAKVMSLYGAKTNLSALVEEAAAGEEIVIAKNGKPKARLVALWRRRRTGRRQAGLYKGRHPHRGRLRRAVAGGDPPRVGGREPDRARRCACSSG